MRRSHPKKGNVMRYITIDDALVVFDPIQPTKGPEKRHLPSCDYFAPDREPRRVRDDEQNLPVCEWCADLFNRSFAAVQRPDVA